MAFRARGDTAAARHGTLAAFLLHDKMSSPDDDGRELAVIRLAKPFASFAGSMPASRRMESGSLSVRQPPSDSGGGKYSLAVFASDIWVASKAMIRVTQIGRPFPGHSLPAVTDITSKSVFVAGRSLPSLIFPRPGA